MSSINAPSVSVRESDVKVGTPQETVPVQTNSVRTGSGKGKPAGNGGKKYGRIVRCTLPSKLAIPVGLAQVFTGISMVVVGAFSLKYQSYLFFYSSGLWAGTLAGICGIFAILSTKKGLRLPEMCGGPRYQIHVFLGTTLVALSAAVLLFVLSTSGLLQNTTKPVGVEIETLNKDDETFEKRKSSGTAINAILLFLSLLQVLLSFMSLGMSIRVLCVVPPNSSLLSSSESQNDGLGREYIEKKYRLLSWLGHQRVPVSPNTKKQASMSEYTAGAPTFLPMPMTLPRTNRRPPPPPTPTLMPFPFNVPMMHPPHIVPYMEILSSRPHHPNFPIFIPICPPQNVNMPVRRSLTQLVSSGSGSCSSSDTNTTPRSSHNNKQRKRCNSSSHSSEQGSRSHTTSAAQSVVGSDVANNKEVEPQITEEDVSHSYSGLDRDLAEDFIKNSMVKSTQ